MTTALDPTPPTGIFLDGGFHDTGRRIAVRDPYGGEVIAEVSQGGAADVERAVARALRHLPPPPAHARAEVLERAARLVSERGEAFAHTICREAGKPLRQARQEAARCVDTLTYSAAEARTLAGEMVPFEGSAAGAGKLGLVVHEPIGVIGAISPFNFPLNLVAHKVAPAIAAGCPVVLKPASATPLSALLLAATLAEAGLPEGFLAVIPGGGRDVGDALVTHPAVAMISFTGSGPVGWGIRERAPRKHVALELGNATPVIVAEDADLDHAARRLAASGYTHAGQSCISVQRVYVQRAVHDAFLERFAAAVADLAVGDPSDAATDVGPVIDRDNHRRVLDWIGEAQAAGARVVRGGEDAGAVITPAVLDGITPDLKVSCEEVFGPVVGVAAYDTPEEAIALANGSPYGLQAGIFTARVDRALVWARGLHFGGVVVNETPTFRADQQPYGGVKDSGNTREGPRYAVRSMTEPKLIALSLPPG
ncbi:MAG TPA: aldehyde dehydrogenase family protein [Miltoncostaeaceae bacterium]|nr:aldehyde dehydrogenase family protein [Miltoncostaeaceae bacterium]